MKFSYHTVAFLGIKLAIVIVMLIFRMHFNQFLLLLVIDYGLEITFNFIKIDGTGTGNKQALENDMNYRPALVHDYLMYNLYILGILLLPLYFSLNFFTTGEQVISIDILPAGILILTIFIIRIIDCIIYFSQKENERVVIEEILSLNMIRILIFSILMIFSGAILMFLSQAPSIIEFSLIIIFSGGDFILNSMYNQEKEYIIF